MAPSKPKSKSAAKPAAKKPAAKAPAKAVAKAVAKKAVAKPAAKPAAKPVAKPVAIAAAPRPAHLHAVPSPKRNNAPSPKWIDNAIAYAQQNPAVSVVSFIAVAVGIMLLIS